MILRELLIQLDEKVIDLRDKLALEFKPEVDPQVTLAAVLTAYQKHVKARAALESELEALTAVRPFVVAAIKKQEQEAARIAALEAEAQRQERQAWLLKELDNAAFGSIEQADCLAELARITPK